MKTIILDATTKIIRAKLGGVPSVQPDMTSAYADWNGSAFTPGNTNIPMNSASYVTIVGSPAASTQRTIKDISVTNLAAAAVTMTLELYNSSGAVITVLAVVTLQPNDTWTTDGTYDSTGALKQTVVTATNSINLTGGAANSIPYQTAGNTTGMLAQGTGVLQESAGAPAWTQSPALLSPTMTTQSPGDNTTKGATTAYVDAADALDVHLTGNQTIAGVKTLSSALVEPIPTSTAGTANAQLLASTGFALTAGARLTFIAYATNTAAWTLAVNGLAAKNVMCWAGPTTPGMLSYAGMVLTGGTYTVIYDGTQFILLNPSALRGVIDGSIAAAGVVGEVISSLVPYASRAAMTTATAKNITSIALTAGDWEISGSCFLDLAGVQTSAYLGASVTPAALPPVSSYGAPNASGEYLAFRGGEAVFTTTEFGPYRFSTTGTPTLYLIVQAAFTGTCNANGYIQARRVR